MTSASQVKTCTGCRLTLPISEFYRNQKYRDGLSYRCRDCTRQQVLESELRRRELLGEDEYRRRQRESVARARRDPERRERERQAKRASDVAKSRLAAMYPYEYEKLLAEARIERGLPAERWERPR